MDWNLPTEVAVPDALAQTVGGHPLVAQIMARRGITDPQAARAFLDPAHYRPAPPSDLPDLDTAAQALTDAIAAGRRILVWGDFDVDGQTSTALLVDALGGLGARVRYHVPHRLTEGHGIQPDVLRGMLPEVDLIVTCDTGVTAFEGAALARQAGVPLLITDHHALGPALPDASAAINPQRLPEGHPLRDLPGVGVAFVLAQALYALAGRPDDARRLLDLVALGIVADVVTQRGDTRYLLQVGLDALRYPQRTGLQALMAAAQVDPSTMSSDILGFQIGPRLNALGRLDDARLAVELLTTIDMALARQVAAQLEILNNRRKQIEDQIYAAAEEQIARDPSVLSFDALVLGGPHWHAGVIGIVAARLAEQHHKPVVLLVAPETGLARGSARSTPGVDISAAIAACADLLVSHGGHAGAAGLALDAERIPMLRRRLSAAVAAVRRPEAAAGRPVDAVFRIGELSMGLAEDLNRLAPFGPGNPPVTLLIPGLRLVTAAEFGHGKHRRVTVEDDHGVQQTLTWWRGVEHPLPYGPFDLLLIPRVNDYKGARSLQLEWLDSRPTPGAVVEEAPSIQIEDRRAGAVDVPDEGLIWAEAAPAADFTPGQRARMATREALQPSPTLIVWTAPPGPQELVEGLARACPRRVVVLARYAPPDTPQAFLERLAGLVKYAISHYGGQASIMKLAGATAQREITVRRGLEWLAAQGKLGVEWLDNDEVRCTRGGAPDPGAVEALQDDVRALLAETAAFRAYFRQADLDALIGQ